MNRPVEKEYENSTHSRAVVIGIGANIGQPLVAVRDAVNELEQMPWLSGLRASSLYRTSPVGMLEQPSFVNAVVVANTVAPASWILEQLQAMERRAGRREDGIPWGPRVLDLDLLALGFEEVSTKGMQLPHPEMCDRRFVLEPLAELLPRWEHPVSGIGVDQLLSRLDSSQKVEIIREEAS